MLTFKCLLVLSMVITPIFCYSAGAPETPEACIDLTPKHGVNAQPLSTSPYSIVVSKSSLRAGEKIEVTLRGNSAKDTLKGFILQARVGNSIYGHWEVAPNDSHVQTLSCGNLQNVS